ncbi:unnamed protein product [Pleuronectes platessa]|uniref:Uncharacterized protein n=1 Tax=Pleuronectes platessa TaxID=8262 RepID=A0A9N7VGP1_PLEPL|nr:unnamed protein product [Pleuronectes platessa]
MGSLAAGIDGAGGDNGTGVLGHGWPPESLPDEGEGPVNTWLTGQFGVYLTHKLQLVEHQSQPASLSQLTRSPAQSLPPTSYLNASESRSSPHLTLRPGNWELVQQPVTYSTDASHLAFLIRLLLAALRRVHTGRRSDAEAWRKRSAKPLAPIHSHVKPLCRSHRTLKRRATPQLPSAVKRSLITAEVCDIMSNARRFGVATASGVNSQAPARQGLALPPRFGVASASGVNPALMRRTTQFENHCATQGRP